MTVSYSVTWTYMVFQQSWTDSERMAVDDGEGDGDGDEDMDIAPDPPLFPDPGSEMDVDSSHQQRDRKSRKSLKRVRSPQGNGTKPIDLTAGQVICVDGRILEVVDLTKLQVKSYASGNITLLHSLSRKIHLAPPYAHLRPQQRG